MMLRFTNTEKWADAWFCGLKPLSKLLFLYLCDQCDIAGFYEINDRKAAFDLGIGKQEVEGILQGFKPKFTFSPDERYLFIPTFLEHQKNLPLSIHNRAHKKIFETLVSFLPKFNISYINQYFKEGVLPPTWGTNFGKYEDYVLFPEEECAEEEQRILTWRDSYDIYVQELKSAYNELIHNDAFISERQEYYSNLDIKLSIRKACVDFWGTERGWKHKKKSKTISIDWKATFVNALDIRSNQVWKRGSTSNPPPATSKANELVKAFS